MKNDFIRTFRTYKEMRKKHTVNLYYSTKHNCYYISFFSPAYVAISFPFLKFITNKNI